MIVSAEDDVITARTGSGSFFVIESVHAKRVQERVQLVILFQPYASVTISLSTEKAHQVIDALEKAVSQ